MTVRPPLSIVTMRLLDFVAMWGMILMPMGAIVFVDFYLLQRWGMISNYAERTGITFNAAAGLAWFAADALADAERAGRERAERARGAVPWLPRAEDQHEVHRALDGESGASRFPAYMMRGRLPE